ncbi:MAG: ATP-binding protein, partial [Candidatus Dormibacteraceae bacterium]
VSFVGQPKPLMIDEVQRGGDELVLAIKSHVDRYPDPSQFVLAGSTRFLSTPSLSESLAGRAAILNIWPFAEQELAGVSPSFIDLAFENSDLLRELSPSTVSRSEYFTRIYRGGYPEAMVLSSARLRESWYETYLQSVVEADMREMTRIGEPSNLLSMMRILASNTSQEANVLKIADALQLHRHTATRYLSLLESVFLLHQVPAWSRNLLARVVRRPKLHLTDTGLAAYLLGVDQIGLSRPIAPARGPLVETFVVNELAKQLTWSRHRVRLHHWRISGGPEVDLLLERADGLVVGIEVKATDTIRKSDFTGLAALRDGLGADFIQGFALYSGANALSFGDRLTALPLSALWSGSGS